MNVLGSRIDKNHLLSLLSQRVIYHGLFWLGLLILLIFIDDTKGSFGYRLSIEMVNIISFAIIVYFNLYYLIPNYLTKTRLLHYSVLLLVATVVITPLKVIVLYFLFISSPSLQSSLLSNLNGYFLSTFVVASGSTVIRIVLDWFRQLRESQELHTRTMQSELRFLKSQINPHFLFNTLNNLYALTLKKSDKAPEIVIKLSEMMRYMLYECNEKQVPLQKEINYLRNYLDLEKLRQGKNVQINFDVQGEVSEQKLAPLLFIPFLENSFKHGLNNQLSQGFVNISLKVEDNQVHFFIENSKANTPHRPGGRRSGGIGLVNVNRRLDLLYPAQYDLKIDDNPHSYAINLYIKLQ